jgi:hypothetical protein
MRGKWGRREEKDRERERKLAPLTLSEPRDTEFKPIQS